MLWGRMLLAGILGCVVAVVIAACGGSSKNALTPGTTGTTTASLVGGKGEDASAGPVPGYNPTGTLVADNGFRPDKNGFPFENYCNEGNPQNLNPAAMAQLFGDQVCASGSGDSCQLSPPAQQWMDQANQGMGGGHCEGFSVESIRMYKGSVKPDEFGANDPFALALGQNLQGEIAKAFVTQDFPTVQQATINGTPSDIVNKLIEVLKSKSDYYTVGIYKFENGQKTAGHAVTPFAVEDKGNGKMNILIYDNNYPGKTRAIEVDTSANTWQYDAQTNPNNPSEVYKGDAQTQTLNLEPESVGEGQQPCPFCNGAGGGSQGKGSKGSTLPTDKQYNEITLESDPSNHSHLLITDEKGQKLGYDNGNFVDQIPGSYVDAPRADRDWTGSSEPTYHVPVGTKVNVTIDGSNLQSPDTENLNVIGPGTDATVDDIKMEQGQKDELTFDGNGTGFQFKVDPNQGGSPVLNVGFSSSGADYGFAITPTDLAGGSDIALNLDQQAGQLKLNTTGTKGSGTYAVGVVRISEDGGEQKFTHDHLSLSPDETASLDYSQFTQSGQSIKLDISGSGGSRSEELTPAQ